MALHDLRITVVDGGTAKNYSGGSENPFNYSTGGGGGYSSISKQSDSVGNELDLKTIALKTYAAHTAISIAKQTALSAFQYVVSDIGRSTGDSNLQSIVNRKIEIAQEIGEIISGAASGAISGFSVGGPVGAAVGAVMGLASSATNLAFKYAERERAYEHVLFKESTSQAYQLARANYSATTGRMR